MKERIVLLSLSEYLFEKIAEKIMSGAYKVGQKLVENDLQTEYDVSKSPVREAFQMLINVGLIERKARRGCYVRQITQQAIIDNYVVRAGVEKIAAKLAYEKRTEAGIRALKSIYQDMKKAVDHKNKEEYDKQHDRFQSFFAEISGNETLSEICKKIRMQNMWYRTQYSRIDILADLHTHDALLLGYETGDASSDEYASLMEDHINVGLKNFLSYYSASQTGREV